MLFKITAEQLQMTNSNNKPHRLLYHKAYVNLDSHTEKNKGNLVGVQVSSVSLSWMSEWIVSNLALPKSKQSCMFVSFMSILGCYFMCITKTANWRVFFCIVNGWFLFETLLYN